MRFKELREKLEEANRAYLEYDYEKAFSIVLTLLEELIMKAQDSRGRSPK